MNVVDCSVIVPCRNAERWIGTALESIRHQSSPPAEVIVIDDGSSDRSLELVGDSGLAGLRVLHSEHRNGAATRNIGIAAARSPWIAFLDADDVWAPDHLARAEALLAGTQDVAYQAHFNNLTADGRVIERAVLWPWPRPVSGLGWQDYPAMLLRSGRMFGMSSVVVDRARLVEVGMLDPSQRRRHDIDMWFRVIAGRSWAFDPAPSSYYRIGVPESVSTAVAEREYFFLRAVIRAEQAKSGPAMRALLRAAARSAMSAALTDGDVEDRRRAADLAWPWFGSRDRLIFTLACAWPELFGALNRLRRRALGFGPG